MQIDLEHDVLLTFPQVSARLPGRPNLSTLHRWRLHGVRGGVKLPTVLIGGRRFVKLADLESFVVGLSTGSPTMSAPSARRKKQIADADAILARAGI